MQDLSQVLWIGGPAASGKTTVGRRLARRNGLRWYSCDTRTWVHRDRAVAAGHPGVLTWAEMSVPEREAADTGFEPRRLIDSLVVSGQLDAGQGRW